MNNIFDCATSFDIQARRPDFAVLPIGSFEQHGAHLPMETDTLIACSIARRLAQLYNCFMLSPITVSCSHEHSAFFPSVWISPSTLYAIIKDVVDALESYGLRKICIINAHGGNYILKHFAQIENIDKNKILLMPISSFLGKVIEAAGLQHSQKMDMHAGEYETSVLLADYPHLVKKDLSQDYETTSLHLFHLHGMRHYSKSGVIGYPEQASAEKGERIMFHLINALKPSIEEFISLNHEKIVQKLYDLE